MTLWDIFDEEWLPVGGWVEVALDWVVANFRFVFQAIKVPFDIVLTGLEDALTGAPEAVAPRVAAFRASFDTVRHVRPSP